MIPVDAIEMGVFSWPKGMEGWRFYRIEYGGHAMDCVEEAGVWLPPETDVERVLRVIRGEEPDEITEAVWLLREIDSIGHCDVKSLLEWMLKAAKKAKDDPSLMLELDGDGGRRKEAEDERKG